MLNTKAQNNGYFGDLMGSGMGDTVIKKGTTGGFGSTGGYTRICFMTVAFKSLNIRYRHFFACMKIL